MKSAGVRVSRNVRSEIGNGLTDAPVGSLRNVYLVVTDLEAARSRERGVDVGEIRYKTPIGAWDGGFAPGLDPARGDYATSPTSPIRMATVGCYRNGATAMCDVCVVATERNCHGRQYSYR